MPDDASQVRQEPPAEPPTPQPTSPPDPAPDKDKQPVQAAPSDNLPKIAPPAEEHHLIPVILAIIVLVLLAAVAVLGRGKLQPQPTVETQRPSQTSQDRQTIDDSINTINNLSGEEDTSGQNLSDQNLGL